MSAVVAAWTQPARCFGQHRHFHPRSAALNKREIKSTSCECKMTGFVRPVSVKGRYFWVDDKRVGAFPLLCAVLSGLIDTLTCPMGRSSW